MKQQIENLQNTINTLQAQLDELNKKLADVVSTVPLISIAEYVKQHAPDYKPNWEDQDEAKYFIRLEHNINQYSVFKSYSNQAIGVVYMPQKITLELRDKLNAGELRLSELEG